MFTKAQGQRCLPTSRRIRFNRALLAAAICISLANGTAFAATSAAALARLATHKAVLSAQGVTNLSALGTLTISGTVVPTPGFVRAPFIRVVGPVTLPTNPATLRAIQPNDTAQAVPEDPILKPGNMTTIPITVHSARGLASGNLPAVKIIGEPFVTSQPVTGPGNSRAATATVPLFTAYWVANAIVLPANTNIVIQPNIRFLVIIANSITVASSATVTITYEDVPVVNAPAVPGKPTSVPGNPDTPNPFHDGTIGGAGDPGTQPLQIGAPPDAPQVEMWTMALDQNRLPTVLLKGQHGYKGVQGGVGGDGGPGGDGSDSDHTGPNCNDGPGAGGAGGKGGRGGDGGKGGNGGTGGRWSLYAPTIPTSMTIDVSGGERGEGGDPGSGGNGGGGGNLGAVTKFCSSKGRTNGTAGAQGDPGVKGPDGVAGAILQNSIAQTVIQASDFNNALNAPIIQTVNPQFPLTATVGSQITVNGLRFTNTDTLTVGGQPATITFRSIPTMIVATVPNTFGGVAQVAVVRADGTISNKGTLFIQPVILSTVPPSPSSRLKPGTPVTIIGTGFSAQTSVRVNHQDVAVVASTPTTLTFIMSRPASIPHDPTHAAGEPAVLSVAGNGPIIESATVPIVIATYQILVMGDSIIWSEGLQEPDKIHSLVEAYVKTLHPGIEVYKTVVAHTGAVLSFNVPITGTAHNGDIPQDDPTIQQQENSLAALPNASTIDLILMTSCANDVGFKHFLDPLATHATIAARVSQYCFTDMAAFLTATAGHFPAATIIDAGYYQGLSMDTDTNYYTAIAGVYYGLSDNQGLLPQALAASVGISSANASIVTGNAAFFASQANMQLNNAVAAANTLLTPHRLFFADPGFGPTNAANASNAWVFGLSGVIPGPTDSSAALSEREGQCAAVYSNTSSTDYTFCRLASTGHPNETGAMKYFAAIKPFVH